MELSLSEKVCYSTLRIEATIGPNSISTGTGFFFNFNIGDDKSTICLVTNNHVIENSTTTAMVLSCWDATGAILHESFQVETKLWIPHPDPNIDLCLFPFQSVMAILLSMGKVPIIAPLDESIVPSNEQLEALSSIEDIIMIGYPDGIWDKFNNQPIVRRGITATHVKNDFNGKSEFLIDAACFPGSSGSPVLILNSGGYVDKRGNLNWGGGRIFLLGVLRAGPQHTAEGTIQFANIPRFYTGIPNNLGLVIKSSKLLDFRTKLLSML